MDILDRMVSSPTEETDLDSFVQSNNTVSTLPIAATRNRAASAAFLSEDPAKAIETYQLMNREAEEGKDTTYRQITEASQKANNQLDLNGVMKVLSDPSLPFEKKQEALKAFNGSAILKDNNTTLLTNSLTAVSEGEPKEQEDARINTVDSIREIYQSWQAVQGIQNAHGAGLDSPSSKTFFEMLEAYVLPFGNNIPSGKMAIANAEKEGRKLSTWEKLKYFLKPGTATRSLADSLSKVPPSEREKFAQELVNTISAHSGIVFSNNNQFEQFDKASNIFEQGGYGSASEFIDNVSPLLDLIGVGQMIRGGTKAVKARGVLGAIKEGATPRLGALEGLFARTPPLVSEGQAPYSRLDPRLTDAPVNTSTGNKIDPTMDLFVDDIPATTPVAGAGNKPATSTLLGGSGVRGQTTEAPGKVAALLKATPQPTPGGSVLTGGTGIKQAEPVKQTASLFKPRPPENTGIFKINEDGSIDEVRRIELNSTVRTEIPSAPANVIQQGNPSQARNLHEAVVKSLDDEAATALYGVSREQAIINDVYPQVATTSGDVTSKVPNIQKNLLTEIQAKTAPIIDLIDNTGAIYYTRGEKAIARAAAVNDFKNAEGLSMNEAMSSFKLDGGKIQIDAVYGLAEGSFLKPGDAMLQARLALRNYGVLDEEIELLRKEGLDHIPVRLEDVEGMDGNYLIRVKTSHEIDPTDIGRLETFDVKRNLFDRISPWLGKFITSPNRWLFDAASTLHPTITGAAVVATDATARFEHAMIRLADEFATKLKSVAKDRKPILDQYIREANYNGVAFDHTDLKARGFSPEEISTLKSWRDFWDAHYYLENYDMVRTLNSQGFGLFKNSNVELFAKPIAKDSTLGKLYDPATDTVIVHTKAEGDALYASGGHYARLRRPTDFGGDVTEYMIVRNNANEYIRGIRSTDTVLNYREGYYQLQYSAPKFVDEVIRDAHGVETGRKAVAVAGDTAEAQAFANRMASTAQKEYRVRGDARALQRGSDDWWDLQSSGGRIAQRHRGQLLEDTSGLNHLGDGSYVIDPAESAIRAARSISGRTVNRPMLEASKARAITQYGDMFPSNGMGGRRWPKSLDEIGIKGEPTSSRVADARTTFEYINYLENGYINNIDNAFKATMNGLADMLGSKGFSTLERTATKLGESAPTSLAKNGVFMAYIGSNILRQWIVQTHQVVRTFAYNPIGWANGKIAKYTAEYAGSIMGLTGETGFTKFLKQSGMLDAVDKQNLVRGALRDAADSTNPAMKAVGTATNAVRRVGFDVGESANLLGHAAAVYERYVRTGLNLTDKHVRDEAFSEIRALSYDMNFAGDMPYNQTSPAMLLQFMQVPHKAVLQMTNRRLPWQMRGRMLAADLVMWGPPSVLISDILGADLLPDNPQAREFYLYGAESMLLNNMFNDLIEPGTNIDFSGLDPYDMQGWGRFFVAMYSGGMNEMFMNSPAGQLFVKDQGRTQNAIAAMQRWFAGFTDADQPPESFIEMMGEIAKISSGISNATKAYMLLEAKKRMDKYGSTVDQDVNHVEAWAQLFGFGTYDTKELYEISKRVSSKNKQYKEDVIQEYQTIKQYYSRKFSEGDSDPRFISSVSGWILNRYKDEPAASKILASELERDLGSKESALLRQMIKAAGIPDPGSLKDDVKRSPLSEQEKKDVLQLIEDVQKARTQKPKE